MQRKRSLAPRPPESATAMDTYIRITLGEVPLFGR
jgi:hypothetical protein